MMHGLGKRIINQLGNGFTLSALAIFTTAYTKNKTSILSSSPTTSNLDCHIFSLVQWLSSRESLLHLNATQATFNGLMPNLFTNIWANDI